MSTASKKKSVKRTSNRPLPSVMYTTEDAFKDWQRNECQPPIWYDLQDAEDDLGGLENVKIVRISYTGTPATLEYGTIDRKLTFIKKESK